MKKIIALSSKSYTQLRNEALADFINACRTTDNLRQTLVGTFNEDSETQGLIEKTLHHFNSYKDILNPENQCTYLTTEGITNIARYMDQLFYKDADTFNAEGFLQTLFKYVYQAISTPINPKWEDHQHNPYRNIAHLQNRYTFYCRFLMRCIEIILNESDYETLSDETNSISTKLKSILEGPVDTQTHLVNLMESTFHNSQTPLNKVATYETKPHWPNIINLSILPTLNILGAVLLTNRLLRFSAYFGEITGLETNRFLLEDYRNSVNKVTALALIPLVLFSGTMLLWNLAMFTDRVLTLTKHPEREEHNKPEYRVLTRSLQNAIQTWTNLWAMAKNANAFATFLYKGFNITVTSSSPTYTGDQELEKAAIFLDFVHHVKPPLTLFLPYSLNRHRELGKSVILGRQELESIVQDKVYDHGVGIGPVMVKLMGGLDIFTLPLNRLWSIQKRTFRAYLQTNLLRGNKISEIVKDIFKTLSDHQNQRQDSFSFSGLISRRVLAEVTCGFHRHELDTPLSETETLNNIAQKYHEELPENPTIRDLLDYLSVTIMDNVIRDETEFDPQLSEDFRHDFYALFQHWVKQNCNNTDPSKNLLLDETSNNDDDASWTTKLIECYIYMQIENACWIGPSFHDKRQLKACINRILRAIATETEEELLEELIDDVHPNHAGKRRIDEFKLFMNQITMLITAGYDTTSSFIQSSIIELIRHQGTPLSPEDEDNARDLFEEKLQNMIDKENRPEDTSRLELRNENIDKELSKDEPHHLLALLELEQEIFFSPKYHRTNPEKRNKAQENQNQLINGGLTLKPEFFIARFLQEVLRLHSPVHVYQAELTANHRTNSGRLLTKGTSIYSSMVLLHKDDHFPDNPDNFSPRRFISGGFLHVVPFGFLARLCPGQGIARSEAMITLAKLIQDFRSLNPTLDPPNPMNRENRTTKMISMFEDVYLCFSLQQHPTLPDEQRETPPIEVPARCEPPPSKRVSNQLAYIAFLFALMFKAYQTNFLQIHVFALFGIVALSIVNNILSLLNLTAPTPPRKKPKHRQLIISPAHRHQQLKPLINKLIRYWTTPKVLEHLKHDTKTVKGRQVPLWGKIRPIDELFLWIYTALLFNHPLNINQHMVLSAREKIVLKGKPLYLALQEFTNVILLRDSGEARFHREQRHPHIWLSRRAEITVRQFQQQAHTPVWKDYATSRLTPPKRNKFGLTERPNIDTLLPLAVEETLCMVRDRISLELARNPEMTVSDIIYIQQEVLKRLTSIFNLKVKEFKNSPSQVQPDTLKIVSETHEERALLDDMREGD